MQQKPAQKRQNNIQCEKPSPTTEWAWFQRPTRLHMHTSSRYLPFIISLVFSWSQLTWCQERQKLNSKQNIFISSVVTHVCPPLRLTNTDIGLVVCTAWVMWHQSDLQNSRGGAINHIGSGINHCVEDIFCHRCPLTITLHKTLAPSLLQSHPSFFFLHRSISHQSERRLVSRGRERRGRCPFRHSFKYEFEFIEPSEMLTSRENNRRRWGLCLSD